MSQLNPATQTAFQKILDDYGQGIRRFEYDKYTLFTKKQFITAMHKLKQKTETHLIRRYKAYYTHSDLAYDVVDADTVGKRIILPAKSPQSYQNLTQTDPY